MRHMRHGRGLSLLTDHACGIAAAGIFLVPVATVPMPIRAALVARAVAALALTLAAVAATVRLRGMRDGLVTARKPILLGLALNLAATCLATVVALARGNDPIRLAGQVLALGLVPLAAMTLLATTRDGHWRSLAGGVVAAFAVGAVVQLVVAVLWLNRTALGDRLVLPNGISFGGSAILALALAPCLIRGQGVVSRVLGLAVIPLAVALILLAGVRTHLVGLPIAAAVFSAVALVRGRRPLLWLGAMAAGATLLILLMCAAVWLWWSAPRPVVPIERLPAGVLATPAQPNDPDRAGTFFTPLARLVTPRNELVNVHGLIACESEAWVQLRLRRVNPGRPLHESSRIWVRPSHASPLPFALLVSGDGDVLTLGASQIVGPPCRLVDVTADSLGSTTLAAVAEASWVALRRPPDPDPGAASNAFAGDASLAFRLKEARALIARIRTGSTLELLLGHGLGATFRIDAAGFDAMGVVVPFGETNFIHNLYLFLLFKLGAVGTTLYLAALVLWLLGTVSAALAFAPGSGERLFAAGAAAVWVSYAVMGVTAPHLITYSLTPVFGLLLAALAHLVPQRTSGAAVAVARAGESRE